MYDNFIINIFVFLTGACIGSFLNVAALRALSGESIIMPASKCPKCNTPIKWYDNIPIFSYFLTFKGKCRSCGEKVSFQHPLVETVTAVLFVLIFSTFGLTLKTLLLLILICIAIVITITDIKKEYIYDRHNWIFIITALIYSISENNIYFAFIGFISAAIIMEVIAKLSYYLIRKDDKETSDNIEQNEIPSEKDDEELNINEYIKKYKRAFGEGDTYLAAGVGAILGWKYFIAAIGLAVLLQTLCILPQFILNLYKQKEKRLLFSIFAFTVLAIIYFTLINITNLNIIITLIFIIALLFFAIDSITRLKKTTNENGFSAIPFGPALLTSAFIILFFGKQIISLIKNIIF